MHSITIKASNYRVSKHNLTPLPTLFTLSINSQPLKLTWKKYPSLDKKLIPYFVHDKKKKLPAVACKYHEHALRMASKALFFPEQSSSLDTSPRRCHRPLRFQAESGRWRSFVCRANYTLEQRVASMTHT